MRIKSKPVRPSRQAQDRQSPAAGRPADGHAVQMGTDFTHPDPKKPGKRRQKI